MAVTQQGYETCSPFWSEDLQQCSGFVDFCVCVVSVRSEEVTASSQPSAGEMLTAGSCLC